MRFYMKKPYLFFKNNPLENTIEHGSIRGTGLLLNLGVSANTIVIDDIRLLQVAFEKGNAKIVKFLLKKGADIDLCKSSLKSFLLKALDWEDEEIAKRLLGEIYDVNLVGKALTRAIRWGNNNIINIMLEKEKIIDVTDVDTIFDIPLVNAIILNPKLAVLLINMGVDIDYHIKNGDIPLVTAIGRNSKIAKLLIEKDAKINVIGMHYTPLTKAIACNDIDLVELLINKGANVNLNDVSKTPLTIAIENENIEIIKKLQEAGANVNLPDKNGDTALNIAKEKDNITIVNYLIEKGAKK